MVQYENAKPWYVGTAMVALCLLPMVAGAPGELQAGALTPLQSRCMQKLSSAGMSEILEHDPSPSNYGFHILSGDIKRSNSSKAITWDKTTSVKLEGISLGKGPMGPFRAFTGKGYVPKTPERVAILNTIRTKFVKTITANGGRVTGPSRTKHEGFDDGEGFIVNYTQGVSVGQIRVQSSLGASLLTISCHEDTPLR